MLISGKWEGRYVTTQRSLHSASSSPFLLALSTSKSNYKDHAVNGLDGQN